jgi:hypothetical protein
MLRVYVKILRHDPAEESIESDSYEPKERAHTVTKFVLRVSAAANAPMQL